MDKGTFGRRDRLVKQKRHDTYRRREKWPEPTRCTTCGSVFVNGRWTWENPAEVVNEAVCPACRRMADNYPAGFIEIKGSFYSDHRDELVNLIRNVEETEKADHPLERIMDLTETGGQAVVTTTGIHLARRVGEALYRAYQGTLDMQYGDGEKSIRLMWER